MNTNNAPIDATPLQIACYKVTGCAINILNGLGPGLSAGIYENCLMIELAKAGIKFKTNVPLEIKYLDQKVGSATLPLIVDDLMLVRCIANDKFNDTDYSENLTYIKLCGIPMALLLNFQFGKLQWKKILIDLDASHTCELPQKK